MNALRGLGVAGHLGATSLQAPILLRAPNGSIITAPSNQTILLPAANPQQQALINPLNPTLNGINLNQRYAVAAAAAAARSQMNHPQLIQNINLQNQLATLASLSGTVNTQTQSTQATTTNSSPISNQNILANSVISQQRSQPNQHTGLANVSNISLPAGFMYVLVDRSESR